MAFAVSDHAGELIMVIRMNDAAARILCHAIRRGYTAAIMCRDTRAFGQDLEERGGSLAQWGDRRFTTLQGGIVIKKQELVLGAGACGGAAMEGDKKISQKLARAVASKS